jgi:serine/threonine-protein kinase RsbW
MLTVPGRYENLVKISAYVRQAAQEAGLDGFAVYSVETAVEEACSNIIEHAYGGEDRGEIECTCCVDEAGLTIRLRDHGKPFSPEKVPSPDVRAPLKKRQAHGLGLYIIRKWMDDVQFEFTPGCGNQLTMVKHKEKKTG